jgi:hypothetical protein
MAFHFAMPFIAAASRTFPFDKVFDWIVGKAKLFSMPTSELPLSIEQIDDFPYILISSFRFHCSTFWFCQIV